MHKHKGCFNIALFILAHLTEIILNVHTCSGLVAHGFLFCHPSLSKQIIFLIDLNYPDIVTILTRYQSRIVLPLSLRSQSLKWCVLHWSDRYNKAFFNPFLNLNLYIQYTLLLLMSLNAKSFPLEYPRHMQKYLLRNNNFLSTRCKSSV